MRGETDAHVSRLLNARAGHIEAMTAAFLRMTDIPPDQAVLCEQVKDGVYRWWFERTTMADPARVARLENLLREIEWMGHSFDAGQHYVHCLVCQGIKGVTGHSPHCTLAALLGPAE